MTNLLAPLLSYLLIYRYALLAGVMFASGIVPIPVSTLLIAAGAFASQGYFSLTILLVVATSANVAADFVVYLIARRFGPPALRFFKVDRSRHTERLEHYLREHAGPAIFLTRLVGGLDIAGTVLAGLSGVSAGFFIVFDLLGNAVGVGWVLFLGYFFGAYWQAISDSMGIIGWVLLAAVLAAFFMSYRRYQHRAGGK
jgi:membrane-associated protein